MWTNVDGSPGIGCSSAATPAVLHATRSTTGRESTIVAGVILVISAVTALIVAGLVAGGWLIGAIVALGLQAVGMTAAIVTRRRDHHVAGGPRIEIGPRQIVRCGSGTARNGFDRDDGATLVVRRVGGRVHLSVLHAGGPSGLVEIDEFDVDAVRRAAITNGWIWADDVAIGPAAATVTGPPLVPPRPRVS